VKNFKGRTLYWSVLILVSIFLAPREVFPQGKDYAVEVAALASRDCADELVKGLLSRGLDAYWLKSNQGKLGDYYRVRIGKFPDLNLARNFADNLLDSGLLDTCSITVYEAPLYSLMMKNAKGGNQALLPLELRNTPIGAYCPINITAKNSNKPEAIISSLSSESAPASNRSTAISSSELESKKAIDAAIASTQASMSSIRPKVKMAMNLTAIDAGINKAVNKLVIEREIAARNTSTDSEIIITNRQSTPPSNPSASSASSASSSLSGPSVPSRAERSAFSGNPRPVGGAVASDAGPGSGARLRGFIEMSNGQMVLKLRNLDQQRSFSGLARVTLSDESDSNDAAPLPIDLKPEEEKVLPINEMKQAYGDLMLMVYDQRQTVQLIRSIPYGQRPKASIAANRAEDRQAGSSDGGAPPTTETDAWKINDSGAGPAVDVAGAAGQQQGLPNVTGSFDATQLPDPSSGALPNPTGDNGDPANQNNGAENAPGQIAISPRQISSNNDSATLEVALTGSQPIGYVKVSIRAGSFQDEKVAVFPTSNASVPFLVPANVAKGQFSYEVRNDAGKVIGSGVQSFSPPGPDS
jgi:sporulation related protein